MYYYENVFGLFTTYKNIALQKNKKYILLYIKEDSVLSKYKIIKETHMINNMENSVPKNSDLYFVNFLIGQLQYGSVNLDGNNVSKNDFQQKLKIFNLYYIDDSSPIVGLLEEPYVIDYSYFSALCKNIIMVCNLGIFEKSIHYPCYFDNEINKNIVLYSNKMANKVDNNDCFLIYHMIFQLFLTEKSKIDPDYYELSLYFKIRDDFYSFLDERISFLVKQSDNCTNSSCIETVKLYINIKDNKQIYFPLGNMDGCLATFNIC